MATVTFKPGDEVLTPDGRGTVIDVDATPSGKWVFGVEDGEGRVSYFTPVALRHAES